MTYYVSRAGSPTSDKVFATVADAVASIPSFGGATHVQGNVYRAMGENYEIIEGANPKAARTAAKASIPARMDAATPAQIAYLNKLSFGVSASAYAHWVKADMSKTDASRAIEALKVICAR